MISNIDGNKIILLTLGGLSPLGIGAGGLDFLSSIKKSGIRVTRES